MTDWKKVQGSQVVKPAEFDTTASAVVVYQRKNIERITIKNDGGSTTELWQYEERQMTREEYVMMQLEQNHADSDHSSIVAAVCAFAAISTEIPDASALEMATLFPTWEEVLRAGAELAKGRVISDNDQLYRVMQAVTPQAHQPPDGEGMLAVYRPVNREHAGTLEDPIPWVYGMDCTTGLYYSYEGGTYLCKGDMAPCVWPPDTPGLWQWEAV